MNKSVGGCIIAGPLSDCRNLIETGWATPRSLIASHKARLATSLAYGLSAAWHRPAKICRYCSTARVPKGNSASKRASVAVVSVPTVCSWRSCQSPFYPMRRPTKQTLARPNTQAATLYRKLGCNPGCKRAREWLGPPRPAEEVGGQNSFAQRGRNMPRKFAVKF